MGHNCVTDIVMGHGGDEALLSHYIMDSTSHGKWKTAEHRVSNIRRRSLWQTVVLDFSGLKPRALVAPRGRKLENIGDQINK